MPETFRQVLLARVAWFSIFEKCSLPNEYLVFAVVLEVLFPRTKFESNAVPKYDQMKPCYLSKSVSTSIHEMQSLEDVARETPLP